MYSNPTVYCCWKGKCLGVLNIAIRNIPVDESVEVNTTYNIHNYVAMKWIYNIYIQVNSFNISIGTGVTTYTLHPGVIYTEIFRDAPPWLQRFMASRIINWLFFKTLKGGAQTSIYCAVDEQLSKESGFYYK